MSEKLSRHVPHILGVGAFLPNEPIETDRMEALLGVVNGRPSRSRSRVLKSNGILTRHYAVDPETRAQTHTNAELTAEAVRDLVRKGGFDLRDVDCLACGTSSPDQLVPNHALMVQGELGIPGCEVVATAGTCLSGFSSMKYAAMSVACGMTQAAVATGSELSSSVLRADNFPGVEPTEQELEREPLLAFGQDFLRWMLSDGAGAVWLGPRPRKKGLSLAIDWIEVLSFAHELETCMYWGAEKRADGSLVGWRSAGGVGEALRRGMFNVTQDVRLLGREMGRHTVTQGFATVRERHPIEASEVDWFVPHYSSQFFRQETFDRFRDLGFELPFERWWVNLAHKGNTGSASIFIMLDELFHSGKLVAGQKILCFVPESARFSVGYALLTVVGPER